MIVRAATEADLTAIDAVFRSSFCDTFAHLYAQEDLDAFMGQFTREAWRAEFTDPDYAFRVAEQDGGVVGFVKLGPLSSPARPAGPAIELRQLYLLHDWRGRGVAEALMSWALDEAQSRDRREIYLSVYSDNHRARRFYERFGFAVAGRYEFMVGNHADDELIMLKTL